MKRLVMTYLMLLVLIGISYGQKKGYNSNFTSVYEIQRYYAINIALLDPIEGEYEIEASGGFDAAHYSYTKQGLEKLHINFDPDHYKMYFISNGKDFDVYVYTAGSLSKRKDIKLHPLGDTNVYTFFYHTSSARVYLKNLNHFEVSIQVNKSDCNKLLDPPKGTYVTSMIVNYDCIKVYPTMSMYADAVKRQEEEESKPSSWTGTGFALANNHLVTNYHVVEDAKSISILGVNGDFNTQYKASIIASDKINDLAILKVNDVNIPAASIPYAVKTTISDVGEEIFVLGYPLTSTMGDEIKLTTGVVSSKTGYSGDVALYQISAPVQPGNSGGPLFDSKGNVIGIVSAKHKDAENVGYAVKSSYLRNLMESSLSSNILPQVNRVATQNLAGKVKSVKNFIYYIVCSSQYQSDMPNRSIPTYRPENTNRPRIFDSGSKVSSSGKVYEYPHVNNPKSEYLVLESVVLNETETILTMSAINGYEDGWMNMDKNAFIVAEGERYKLIKAEGIAISPDKTYFSHRGDRKTFKLHFPAIPTRVKSINFFERVDSDWQLLGIQLE